MYKFIQYSTMNGGNPFFIDSLFAQFKLIKNSLDYFVTSLNNY